MAKLGLFFGLILSPHDTHCVQPDKNGHVQKFNAVHAASQAPRDDGFVNRRSEPLVGKGSMDPVERVEHGNRWQKLSD
jgi:hypothetical protein